MICKAIYELLLLIFFVKNKLELKMNEDLLFDHKCAGVYRNETQNSLIVIWRKGMVQSADYRLIWDTTLTFAKKFKVELWLNDETELEIVSPDDLTWAFESWFPRSVEQLGMKRRVALVVSKRFYTEMGTSNLLQKFGAKGEEAIFNRFKDRDSALNWLYNPENDVEEG